MSHDWLHVKDTNADWFLSQMLRYGKPIEVTLVGAFDEEGRGSRRDIDLPLHRDGDYSTDVAARHSIDYVGLYCVEGNDEVVTFLECDDKLHEIVLKRGDALIFNNKRCRHGRKGSVGDRILLRVWIEKDGT